MTGEAANILRLVLQGRLRVGIGEPVAGAISRDQAEFEIGPQPGFKARGGPAMAVDHRRGGRVAIFRIADHPPVREPGAGGDAREPHQAVGSPMAGSEPAMPASTSAT